MWSRSTRTGAAGTVQPGCGPRRTCSSKSAARPAPTATIRTASPRLSGNRSRSSAHCRSGPNRAGASRPGPSRPGVSRPGVSRAEPVTGARWPARCPSGSSAGSCPSRRSGGLTCGRLCRRPSARTGGNGPWPTRHSWRSGSASTGPASSSQGCGSAVPRCVSMAGASSNGTARYGRRSPRRWSGWRASRPGSCSIPAAAQGRSLPRRPPRAGPPPVLTSIRKPSWPRAQTHRRRRSRSVMPCASTCRTRPWPPACRTCRSAGSTGWMRS